MENKNFRKGLTITSPIPEVLVENHNGKCTSVYLNGERFGEKISKVEFNHKARSNAELKMFIQDEEIYNQIKEIAPTLKVKIDAIREF